MNTPGVHAKAVLGFRPDARTGITHCPDTSATLTSGEQAGRVWHIGAGSDGVTGPLHICLLRADENDHTGRLLAGDSGTRALAALGEEAECVWRLGDGCNAMTGRL